MPMTMRHAFRNTQATLRRATLAIWAGAVASILLGFSQPASAGEPYGTQAYGVGWYGYGAAELILDKASIMIPEGASTQLVLRLSTQPPSSQTVTVSRISGDANVGISGATNFVFSTNNWNQNQAFTITAAVNVAHLDGTAIVQCAAMEITGTNVSVLRSGSQGASDTDQDSMSNQGEYIAGTDWRNPYSMLVASVSATGGAVRVGFNALAATGPDYTGQTRHYRVEQRADLVSGQWVNIPGATNIVTNGWYDIGTTTSRYYRVRVWLTTP